MRRRDYDGRPVPGQRSGTIPRGALRRAEPPSGSFDWIILVAIAALAGGVILAISGMLGGSGSPAGSGSPPPRGTLVAATGSAAASPSTPALTAAQSPTMPPTATPTEPPTPSPTTPPTPSPTASPTQPPTLPPSATAPPTARPTPLRTPAPSPQPTPPAAGLTILEPADGQIVTERSIVVRGLAPPGATITRDIPFWFDEHTRADAAGRWSFAVSLVAGDNKLTFRVGDMVSTARTVTVRYEPD